MIFPAEAPSAPECRAPHALYMSMNSPVVSLESLPVGPASATVVLHGRGAALAVRSARSGHLIWFATSDELLDSPRVALDAALSFAESMGFLFDDEQVEADFDAATRHWHALLDGEEVPGPPAFEADAPELLLEDVVEPESGLVGPPGDATAPAEASGPDSALFTLSDDTEPDEELDDGPDEEPVETFPEPSLLPDARPALLLSKFRRVAGGDGLGSAVEQALEAETGPNLRLRMVSRF